MYLVANHGKQTTQPFFRNDFYLLLYQLQYQKMAWKLTKFTPVFVSLTFLSFTLNPLSSNPTKWSNTLKQFVGKLPTNRLSVFYHFVGLALKGLKLDICCDEYCPPLQEKNMRIERVADCRTCQNSKTLPFNHSSHEEAQTYMQE